MTTSTRWIILNDVENLTFIHKDVISVHNSIFIVFHNLTNHTELVYMAQDQNSGDGIECLIGHKSSYMFAFAEKSNHANILMMTYPDFKIMFKVKDEKMRKFTALEFMDGEYILALSNDPNTITVWSWRMEQKLISYDIGIENTKHTLKSSVISNLFCYFWDDNISVFEIIPTYKACLLQNRVFYKEQISIVDLTWTNDGNLYIVDKDGNVYSVIIDGIHITNIKEWSATSIGENVPMITFYKSGLAIFGPNLVIQHIRKNKEWSLVWSYDLEFPLRRMMTSSSGDNLIIVNMNGDISKLHYESDNVSRNTINVWQRDITMIELVYPNCDEAITLHSDNMVCIWKCNTGILESKAIFEDNIIYMKSHSKKQILALSCGSTEKYGISIINIENDMNILSSICISEYEMDKIIWSSSNEELLASSMSIGEIFHLRISNNWTTLNVMHFINIENILNNVWFSNVDEKLFILALSNNGKLLCYDSITSKNMEVKQIEDSMKYLSSDGRDNLICLNEQNKRIIIICKILFQDEKIHLVQTDRIDTNFDINGAFIENNASFHLYWNKNIFKIFKIQPNIEQTHKFCVSHQFSHNIKNVIVNNDNNLAIALIQNGDFIMYSLKKSAAQRQSGRMEKSYKKDQIKIINISSSFDSKTETWKALLLHDKEKKESNEWFAVRSEIELKYNSLTEKLKTILDENEEADELYRLPMNAFRMHPEVNRSLFDSAATEREFIKMQFENKIKSQDRITEWIKRICWDPMETPGKEVHAIFTDKSVENYPLLPLDEEEDLDFMLQENMRNIEKGKTELLFLTWRDLLETKTQTNYVARQASSNLSLIVEVDIDRKIEDDTFSDFNESTAKLYIEPEKFICSQMLSHSFLQMNWITNKVKKTTKRLQEYFNEEFEKIMRLKQKEISSIVVGNKRLKVIVSELNALNKLKGSDEVITFELEDPQWSQNELPEKLITVDPEEIGISPYISIDEVEKSTSVVIQNDPFYEKALMEMMDGALEKLWEEEIKKPIPKPQCMIDKVSDEYTEADLLEISEWKERVKLHEAEREKYREMLCSEFDILSKGLNDQICNFNIRIDELYLLKLKIESAIGQEELKIMLLKEHSLIRIEVVEKCKELELEVTKSEYEQDQIYEEMNTVQHHIAESHAAYEALASRDRMLDKNFKTNLGDVSPTALDLCYKLFKKRPKWQSKPSMTVGVLYEMASASLIKEKPPFIHTDCLEYLKGIDLMDSVNNMPTMIDETVWATLCKLRRMKIDNEIKMRAATVEINEAEAAYATYQKRMNALRMHQQKLRNDIAAHRLYMEKQAKNLPIQLIVKSGLVEIEMTGHLKDFDDAILIKKEEVEAINARIRKAAQMKVNAERATSKFKKRILQKEWEHAKLKMKIRHLQDDLNYSERIKITKEIQSYIKDKTRHYSKIDTEKKIQATKMHFDKQLLDNMRRVEELELKLGSIRTQIESLDNMINQFNMDIGDKQRRKDDDIKKQKEVTKWVKLFIMKTKIMSDIERQHSTILLLRTEVELQRLRTYPTLTAYQSY